MKKRTKSRVAAVQAIYQWQKSDKIDPGAAVSEFLLYRLSDDPESAPYKEIDKPFFKELVEAVQKNHETVHSLLKANLAEGWTAERMDEVLLALLGCAATELLTMGETPTRVIINEYLEVGHTYFDADVVGFINKTLEMMAGIVREDLKKESL